jgi:hypothetical protein
MEYFLKDDNGYLFPATFTFNSKTGEAVGTFSYRHPTVSLTYNGDSP